LGSDRRHRSRRRLLASLLLGALALSLVVAPGAFADALTPESGGSPNADSIDTLYKIVFAVGIVIFVGVEGALIYSLVKFRARKGRVAAQIHGNTNLEVGWTLGAAAILVILATVTFIKLDSIKNPLPSRAGGLNTANGAVFASIDQPTPPKGKSLNIDVNGQQYIWRYTYPDGDTNAQNNPYSYEEMVVPVDTTVTLDIRSQDVAHSWWIPKLGGKFDAVPGYTNKTWFQARELGVYRGQCAELCGRGHADMFASVRVVSVEDYKAWIVAQKARITAANKAAAADRDKFTTGGSTATQPEETAPSTNETPAAPSTDAGKAVFASAGCGACHTLAEAGSSGKIGPDLDKALAGKDAAFIEESITDPNKEIAKGYAKGIMPTNFGQTLSKTQLKDLVDFLVAATKK
jgi:cytochrome c oxidase subunit II